MPRAGPAVHTTVDVHLVEGRGGFSSWAGRMVHRGCAGGEPVLVAWDDWVWDLGDR